VRDITVASGLTVSPLLVFPTLSYLHRQMRADTQRTRCANKKHLFFDTLFLFYSVNYYSLFIALRLVFIHFPHAPRYIWFLFLSRIYCQYDNKRVFTVHAHQTKLKAMSYVFVETTTRATSICFYLVFTLLPTFIFRSFHARECPRAIYKARPREQYSVSATLNLLSSLNFFHSANNFPEEMLVLI